MAQHSAGEAEVGGQASAITNAANAASDGSEEGKEAEEFEYLRDVVAEQVVDRIKDISRDFEVALDLGCNTGNCLGQLVALGEGEGADWEAPAGLKRLIQVDPSGAMADAAGLRAQRLQAAAALAGRPALATEQHVVSSLARADEAVAAGSVDLVVSSMALHWANDVQGALAAAFRALKPDGAFLCAMLAGETLFELRTALAVAEQEREGGLGAHVSPMVRQSDACGLLSAAGFSLTTVDTGSIAVDCKNAYEVMMHLSMMGESNAVAARRPAVARDTFVAAAAIYDELFAHEDGYVPCTVDVVYMIGWKPHSSQPQPLKPSLPGASLGTLGKGFDLTETKAP